MAQKHLFIMDPFEKLNFKLDTSLALARALVNSGHEAWFCETKDLSQAIGSCPTASSQELEFHSSNPRLGSKKTLELSLFDSIQMRKEPPFDLSYISTTWILDAVRDQTLIVNDSHSLRKYNEKLSLLYFPELCAKGLVSASTDKLLQFLVDSAAGDAIVKPLELYGGRGVERINMNELGETEARLRLNKATKNDTDWRIIQPFDRHVFEGEVRVFAAFGQVISWCLKRPAKNHFLANTGAGATLEDYSPSDNDMNIATTVAKAMYQEGVHFIGLDIIGNYLSEINVTSPRLLQSPGDNEDRIRQVADLLIEEAGSR